MKKSLIFPDHFFPLVIVGMPGSGKTTVSRELARLIGVCEVDTDSEIKRRTRKSIPQVFDHIGESGFRKIEHEAVCNALDLSQGIVALGGGAILHPGTRSRLLNQVVIYLRTGVREAVNRVGDGSTRPLLAGSDDATVAMEELARRRLPLYEEVATVTVDTDDLTPQEVAVRCFEALRRLSARGFQQKRGSTSGLVTRRIPVHAEHPYDVVVGSGILAEVEYAVSSAAKRVLLTHPPTLSEQASKLAKQIRNSHEVYTLEIPDGEAAKTAATLSKCWQVLGEHRFGRKDTIVALGGGATTDLSGFAAASWLRGIEVIQVPTTVLAMVDAAVGGKTGINTVHGKNLVGAFHSPTAVVCDMEFLQTLPRRHLVAGLGEVIKCGFIADPQILKLVEDNSVADLLDPRSDVLRELMERSIMVKAKVVSADLREAGKREILNYGHTFAHAIEKAENYEFLHGEAVAVGCVYAAEIACKLGLCDRDLADRHRAIFAKVGLPISYQNDSRLLLDAMRSDKKVRSDQIRMVLLEAAGQPVVKVVDDAALLVEAMSLVQKAWEDLS